MVQRVQLLQQCVNFSAPVILNDCNTEISGTHTVGQERP